MKHVYSYIFFVITIILTLMLFTACIPILPQETDNAYDDSSGQSEETAEERSSPDITETDDNTETPDKPEPTDNEPKPTDAPTTSASPAPQPDTTKAGVIELFLNEPVLVDLDGDAVMTEIEIIDADGALVLLSTQGGFEHHIVIANIPAGYLTNAYYVKSYDGYPFVVVSYDYCSDDYETRVFTFTDFEPHEEFKLPLYVTLIDGYGFDTYGYVYAIGTWAASSSVYFVLDMIEWRGTYVLDQYSDTYTKAKTVMNLPVQIIQNDNYVDTVLTPGTVLSFVDTDAESYVWFVLADETEGILYFEWNSNWIETIDGIPAYEYFEELPLFG